MPAQKHTIVGVTAARRGMHEGETCVLLEMKFSVGDSENPEKCLRDMSRALQTFQIHADIDDRNTFMSSKMHGPYSLGDQKGVIAMTILVPQEGVDDVAFSAKVRSGVNGVTSLMKQSGYRVKTRIKPIEQLELQGTDGGEAEGAEPEEDESEET